MKTLELTIADRIVLGYFLPPHGGKIKMLLVKSLGDAINLTPEEIMVLEVKEPRPGFIEFNQEKARMCTIRLEITPEQAAILKESMDTADQQEAITLNMLPLVAKIEAL